MNFIIITPPSQYPHEIEIINNLLDLNLATVHLRKPDSTKDMMRDFLNKISPENHPKIVIHDHIDLIQEYNLKGIHYNFRNKNQTDLYKTLNIYKSVSTHSLEEVENLPAIFSYYLLSPIFSSTSKAGYGGNSYDLNDIKEYIVSHPDKKLVALSGITTKNISIINDANFYGAAILGDFWNYCSNKPDKESIISYFKELNKRIQ